MTTKIIVEQIFLASYSILKDALATELTTEFRDAFNLRKHSVPSLN